MRSMTCFGQRSQKLPFGQIDISIKSVNGRFLEIRSNIPSEYLGFESLIKKKISKVITRGTVSLYISRKRDTRKTDSKVYIKTDMAVGLVRSYKELSKELKIDLTPDADTLSRFPSLFCFEEDVGLFPKEKIQVFKLLDRVLQDCLKEKQREGEALHKEILFQLLSLESHLAAIRHHSQAQAILIKKEYEKCIKLGQNKNKMKEDDDSSIAYKLSQELTAQLDRFDLTEEIFRLKEHIKSIKKMSGNHGAMGKRIDFYTQELLREMNTIGSKSQMHKITQTVVESKNIIEKIREQSQNIE